MEVNIGRVKLLVVEGDITQSGAIAIANAANDKLWMGGGVAGAIKRAGGEEIETEAMKKGPLPIGEVAVTGAGNLEAEYILHAVVMGQDLETNADFIRKATENTLDTAENLAIESLALPAFGTGVGKFPPDECAKIMIDATVEKLLAAKKLRNVKIVLKDHAVFEHFKGALEAKFRRK